MEVNAFKDVERLLVAWWGCLGLMIISLIVAGAIGLLMLAGVLCFCPH